MAKSSGQKLKIIYLMDIMLNKTDDEHTININEIILELKKYDISAERKTIYDDLDLLRQYGLNIEKTNFSPIGYHVTERQFETAELKLLVDLVQTSKFITPKKSACMIEKIESLASLYDAKLLQGQVYVANKIKSENESIYYNVDKIHSAIWQNRKINFKYFTYGLDKKKAYKHEGAKYCISPLTLTCNDENYYLLGFDSGEQLIKRYRVDKMDSIDIEENLPREGLAEFAKLDIAAYSSRVFSMFGGEEENVTLNFTNDLIGVVIDHFGKSVKISKADSGHFNAFVTVEVSPKFFGWLVGFGKNVSIVSPEQTQQAYFEHLRSICE